MTGLRQNILALVVAFCGMTGAAPVFAETIMSTATLPKESMTKRMQPADPVLDARLDDLLGVERKAFRAVSGKRIKRLATTPRSTFRTPGALNVSYTAAWVDAQPAVKNASADLQCLSEALYFEARGETVKGQFAVAEVIMNRVASDRFPNTICGVVKQGTGKRYQCQFTYTCDGLSDAIRNKKAYAHVSKVANAMIKGAPRALTGGATYYHTNAVRPRWARSFKRTAQIGVHEFYRRPRS